MPTRLISMVIDAADPGRLARFWADALGWEVTVDESDEAAVEADETTEWGDGSTPCLTFAPVDEAQVGKNRMHLDLASASWRQQRERVDRLLELGAHRADIGQGEVPWVVLADPEGNEFCVLDPRDDDEQCEGIAAVVLDCRDPQGLASFWSQATGWPFTIAHPKLVSLRHPGTAVAPRLELLATVEAKQGKNRVHLDVAPRPGDELDREVTRLEAAGAQQIDVGQGRVSWVVLADPEGNELCVLPPR